MAPLGCQRRCVIDLSRQLSRLAGASNLDRLRAPARSADGYPCASGGPAGDLPAASEGPCALAGAGAVSIAGEGGARAVGGAVPIAGDGDFAEAGKQARIGRLRAMIDAVSARHSLAALRGRPGERAESGEHAEVDAPATEGRPQASGHPTANGASGAWSPGPVRNQQPAPGLRPGLAGFQLRAGEPEPLLIREQRFEPDHCHGRTSIAAALAVDLQALAVVARDHHLGTIDLRRMLLIDTETTGLTGGAGTIPFLIGLGWFEDESLVLAQLLLPRPGAEGPMLRFVAERLAAASVIVSYNGKSFDLPLLRTRFVLQRLFPPGLPPHLDLLHVARRVYRRRLGALRLVHLESALLGFRRERDVEGREIPSIYWSAVRGSDGSMLNLVAEHNANDIVALAALLTRLGRDLGGRDPATEPEDQLSMAEAAWAARDEPRALGFARAAADGGGPPPVTVTALMLLARGALRRESPEVAAGLLREALVAAGHDRRLAAPVHLRLSKLCEHRLKDRGAALEHARQAAGAESVALHERRMARLEARLAAPRRGVLARTPGAGVAEPPRPSEAQEGTPRVGLPTAAAHGL